MAGGWRRLLNEELHNMRTSRNVIGVIKSRTMKLTGQIARMGHIKNAYRILFGRPRRRREDNVRMGRVFLD